MQVLSPCLILYIQSIVKHDQFMLSRGIYTVQLDNQHNVQRCGPMLNQPLEDGTKVGKAEAANKRRLDFDTVTWK